MGAILILVSLTMFGAKVTSHTPYSTTSMIEIEITTASSLSFFVVSLIEKYTSS